MPLRSGLWSHLTLSWGAFKLPGLLAEFSCWPVGLRVSDSCWLVARDHLQFLAGIWRVVFSSLLCGPCRHGHLLHQSQQKAANVTTEVTSQHLRCILWIEASHRCCPHEGHEPQQVGSWESARVCLPHLLCLLSLSKHLQRQVAH